MSWDTKPLGEILNQSGHHRAGGRVLPVLSITMKQGLIDQSDKFKKRVASQDTSNYRIAYKNELVVGFPIDEGVLGFQTKYDAAIVSPAYDVWRLNDIYSCHIPYLERYLRSTQARRMYASRMRGAVARRRSLTKADFLKLEIPFPPLDDQIRIAHLLGKVEELIAQRKQHLQQLDDLLTSIFLEMFGDPVKNDRGWDRPVLGSFGRISTGNTPPRNDPTNYDDAKVEWIKTDNIPADAMIVSASAEHLSATGAKRGRVVSRGALLVACIAGSVESIGRAALTDRRVAFNQQINAIQPGVDVDPIYLYGLFKVSRAYIQRYATKAMKKILTKGDFEKIPMIKPPLDLQNQFATIAESIERTKACYQSSLTDLEILYHALSQRAFKDDLNLSRVALPDALPQEPQQAARIGLTPPVTEALSIHLPATGLLSAALQSRARVKDLLQLWLEAYRVQLNGTPFSAQAFMAVAQARVAELHPENDFELHAEDYDYIKSWVFEALADGRVTQDYADSDNRVILTSAPAQA